MEGPVTPTSTRMSEKDGLRSVNDSLVEPALILGMLQSMIALASKALASRKQVASGKDCVIGRVDRRRKSHLLPDYLYVGAALMF